MPASLLPVWAFTQGVCAATLVSSPTRRGGSLVAQKDPGGKISRRLPDMSLDPHIIRQYRPPPVDLCVTRTFPVDLTDKDRLMIRIHRQNKLIVDFAITQMVTFPHEFPIVARIDCCGGIVHRHQFNSRGEDLLGHHRIAEIPPVGGEIFVHEAYKEAYKFMHDGWERNHRRWRDG